MNANTTGTKTLRIAGFGLAMAVFAVAVCAQQPATPTIRYNITDLGTLGGGFSEAVSVNNRRMLSGSSTLPDGTTHAVLWQKGTIKDIGASGLNGPGTNSRAFDVNEMRQAVGPAETSTTDPHGEDFCSFGTHLTCPSFVWQNGVMTPLRTLGGENNFVGSINNRGQAAGISETASLGSNCAAPFQVREFQAAVWGPGAGQIQELPALGGDSVGEALWINDLGQVVGASGSCANTFLLPLAAGPHAVIWQNGIPTDLGNLGGACTEVCFDGVLGPYGNAALYINNLGQVVGLSATGIAASPFHAFLWTKQSGMQDLGTLPGDAGSVGLGANVSGEVVGLSLDASGNPRAFLRKNGVMTDLNTLIPADSPFLALFVADIINSSGEIAGFGLTNSFEVHGFLATPIKNGGGSGLAAPVAANLTIHEKATLPESVRKMIWQKIRNGRFALRPVVAQ